jgi:hypothetical protein
VSCGKDIKENPPDLTRPVVHKVSGKQVVLSRSACLATRDMKVVSIQSLIKESSFDVKLV